MKKHYVSYRIEVEVTDEIIHAFMSTLPIGYKKATSTKILLDMFNDLNIVPYRIHDESFIAQLHWVALLEKGYPVGSCSTGRFIIKSIEDKAEAISFYASTGSSLDASGNPNRKMQALQSVNVNKSVKSKKTKKFIPTIRTVDEPEESIQEKLTKFRLKYKRKPVEQPIKPRINGEPIANEITDMEFLSVNDTLDYLWNKGIRIKENKLYYWRRKGVGPKWIKFGNSVYYIKDEINSMIADQLK